MSTSLKDGVHRIFGIFPHDDQLLRVGVCLQGPGIVPIIIDSPSACEFYTSMQARTLAALLVLAADEADRLASRVIDDK